MTGGAFRYCLPRWSGLSGWPDRNGRLEEVCGDEKSYKMVE